MDESDSVHHLGMRVKGMESVVATVSGYHGLDRFNLIRLISHAGANYVGRMTKSITHLVCWNFRGMKYDLAKKLGTIVVNHRWVEDCIRHGERVSEDPYTLQSGQEVGPLLLEVPRSVLVDISNNERRMDSGQLGLYNNSEHQMIDMEYGGFGEADWKASSLLNEELFPELGSKNSSSLRKKKEKTPRESLNQEHMSGSGRLLQNVESSCFSRKRLAKGKRKISEGTRSLKSVDLSCKGRRLVRKHAYDDVLHILSDSDEESCPIVLDGNENLESRSNHSSSMRNVQLEVDRQTHSDESGNSRSFSFEGYEDVEEIENWTRVLPEKGINKFGGKTLPIQKRCLQNVVSDAENINTEIEDDHLTDNVTKRSTSMELSCVICWTDFSSIRGVLPCGHRFCYSCIENWAQHMVSRKKSSTCPLCKATFESIIRVEDAATSDQKIYSQTIPHDPSIADISFLPVQEMPSFGRQSLTGSVCSKCRFSEPEDCLVSCHICQSRQIHSYCLDPPLLPWTCTHCQDLQVLYHRNL